MTILEQSSNYENASMMNSNKSSMITPGAQFGRKHSSSDSEVNDDDINLMYEKNLKIDTREKDIEEMKFGEDINNNDSD